MSPVGSRWETTRRRLQCEVGLKAGGNEIRLGGPLCILGGLVIACGGLDFGYNPNPPVDETLAPGILSDAICEASLECDCECTSSGLSGEWISAAKAAGLEYDEECFTRLSELGWIGDCRIAWDDSFARSCSSDCQVYHGAKDEGDGCTLYGRRMSDCGHGLTCGVDGRCHKYCETPSVVEEGYDCAYEKGVYPERCAEGLVCSPESGACAEALGLGEPCTPEASRCETGSWCAPAADATVGECTAYTAVGQPCAADAECESGTCDEGTCSERQAYVCEHPIW